ncbi:hypothetical protein [Phenylobacterium sp.]|uniref:hypothetical protein n=1 Tax=Phenylobacterium sp. TaxID=1871053 RepID=UPI003D27311D
MMRILQTGAALSLVAGLAQAQPAAPPASTQVNPPVSATGPNPPAPPSATTPPATDTTAMAGSPYRTGAIVKDAQGQMIGTIARVIKTPDGATTVSVSVDGRNVNLPASNLTPGADGGAVSAMSKAQITASTKPPA